MKRIYIALSLVLAALCFASVETGFISGKTWVSSGAVAEGMARLGCCKN